MLQSAQKARQSAFWAELYAELYRRAVHFM